MPSILSAKSALDHRPPLPKARVLEPAYVQPQAAPRPAALAQGIALEGESDVARHANLLLMELLGDAEELSQRDLIKVTAAVMTRTERTPVTYVSLNARVRVG